MGLLFAVLCLAWIGIEWFQGKNPERERIPGALSALELWSVQRAFPEKFLPDEAHYAAYEFTQQQVDRTFDLLESTQPWQAIGPHNQGGRVLEIAFNPQNPGTVYAGGASGGLWRSYTGGVGVSAWERIATGFPVLGVGSIAIAPDDSNLMYIATGEVYAYQNAGDDAANRGARGSYGIGILKTTDGGATWSKSLDWSYNQKRGVQAVRMNPLNKNTVWAATTEGTYKSVDAGATWDLMHGVIMANDLAISPSDTNIVVVTYGNFGTAGHGIYRTTDGGAGWTQITQGVPPTFQGKAHLAMYQPPASAPTVFYASIGSGFFVGGPNNASWVCKSVDGGATWATISTTDYSQWQGWFSHDVAVSPSDSNKVIAVGIQVWKSTSGGTNLVQKSSNGGAFSGQVPAGGPEGPSNYVHSDVHDVVYHPTDPNIVYFGCDGGVFRSMDGGETFEGRNGGFQTTQFYNGFSTSLTDSNLALGGLQDNSTAIYLGTTVWDRFNIGGDGSWTGIDAGDNDVLYGSAQGLFFARSFDRGVSWQTLNNVPPTGGFTVFMAPFIVSVSDPQVLYAGRDVVFKSTNGGSSWTATNSGVALDGNPVLAMAMSIQDEDVAYVATAPFSTVMGVFRTTNGGSSWTNITGVLPNRYPGDLTVHPSDDATVYLTLMGFASSHVFKTTDSGSNWIDVGTGLPDVPATAVVIDPDFPDHVYVGNDLGVFVSPDAGQTWQTFQEGLPEAVLAMDLAVSPTNRKIRVATHGNGAWERPLLDGVTSVENTNNIPERALLLQNYPNPFNPSTRIEYQVSTAGPVKLVIYNLLGQAVRTLVDNPGAVGGKHNAVWNGKNDAGQPVASGTYVYRLETAGQVLARKMLLIR